MEPGRTKRSDGQLKDMDAVVYSEVQMLVKLLDSIPQGFRISKNLPTATASKVTGKHQLKPLEQCALTSGCFALTINARNATKESRVHCCMTKSNSA